MQSSDLSLSELDAISVAKPTGPQNLLGARLEELEAACVDLGEAPYRGRQIFAGIFAQRVASFDDLTSLPRSLRGTLDLRFTLARPRLDAVQSSADGTRKYRFVSVGAAADDVAFEAVYIPAVAKTGRTNTLCVSSQSGCAVGCTFCFTASLRRNRNLTTAEILGQVLAVQDDVAELGEGARVTNIVFMGMGEPLLNYAHVVRAGHLLTDSRGCDFSSRRVTISTAGIVPRIHDLGRDINCQLAVSLSATTDAVRDQIMPINRKWPIADLVAALRAFPLAPRRRITIEYVLLGEVNDSEADAKRLVRLLERIPCKVNVLPLNAHGRTNLRPPAPAQVERFLAALRSRGVNAIERTPRGRDIDAACGQLGGAGISLTQ